jgi:hypothetical protein
VILGALLHVALPLVVVAALVLLVIGRSGRRFLRILLLRSPGTPPLDRRALRVRLGCYAAVGFGALCAVKAAETAATSGSQAWLGWTMALLAAVLVLSGGAGLVLTGRRRAAADRRERESIPRR